MKVFQCSSGGMVPTIPTTFPSCYSLQTAATPQDSDYPGIFRWTAPPAIARCKAVLPIPL